MLKNVSTKELVGKLSKREGVNVFKTNYFDSRYQIKIKDPGYVTEREGVGLTTIKEETGQVTILILPAYAGVILNMLMCLLRYLNLKKSY